MRVSAPATTLVLLGLATLAATTTATTGNGTCTPHTWLHGQAASSSMAAASVGLNLPGTAPTTAAPDLICLGGLPIHTGKGTCSLNALEDMGLLFNATAQAWAATTMPYYAVHAEPAVTAVSINSMSFEMVEFYISKWTSSPAILWYDMGFWYSPARPAEIPPPRPRIAKGALQALMAAALIEVKTSIVSQVRAWGLQMLVASALFAAAWKNGTTTFVYVSNIAMLYAPVLLTGLLRVYTAVVFLIGFGGMCVIFSTTSWHMEGRHSAASRPALEVAVEVDKKMEEEEKEEEDWTMVEMEEEMDESNSPAQEAVGQDGQMSVLSVIFSSYIVISTSGSVLLMAVLMCHCPLLSFIKFIIATTNKATSTEEGEEERVDLLFDGLLGDSAPVLPSLVLVRLGNLICYLLLLLTKENILAKVAAAIDVIITFEKSVQPLYEKCVNITWYLLACLALLAVALVVLLARVALWTLTKVMGTFIVEEEEGEKEGDAATYPNLLPLAYPFTILAIPGSFWVAGIIIVLYLALPDGSKEERLSISAGGADTERYRSESGLPSAARRVLQRVSVSLGVGRTSSREMPEKEGEEVMADGC